MYVYLILILILVFLFFVYFFNKQKNMYKRNFVNKNYQFILLTTSFVLFICIACTNVHTYILLYVKI